MAHFIEVQGETNPLTPHNLYNVLSTLSSPNAVALKTGAEQLKNWERHPGYFSLLQVCQASNANLAQILTDGRRMSSQTRLSRETSDIRPSYRSRTALTSTGARPQQSRSTPITMIHPGLSVTIIVLSARMKSSASNQELLRWALWKQTRRSRLSML